MHPAIRGLLLWDRSFGTLYCPEYQKYENGRRGRSIDITCIDLITEKLGIIYINKAKMAQLREYGLLSELRYPVGQYRSRASKHKKTVRCCTTILQRPREGQRGFCTRECNRKLASKMK